MARSPRCPYRADHGEIICDGALLWGLTYSEMAPPDARQALSNCPYCNPTKTFDSKDLGFTLEADQADIEEGQPQQLPPGAGAEAPATGMKARVAKTCNDCRREKPLEAFTAYRTVDGGRRYRAYCKSCANGRTKAWYHRPGRRGPQ